MSTNQKNTNDIDLEDPSSRPIRPHAYQCTGETLTQQSDVHYCDIHRLVTGEHKNTTTFNSEFDQVNTSFESTYQTIQDAKDHLEQLSPGISEKFDGNFTKILETLNESIKEFNENPPDAPSEPEPESPTDYIPPQYPPPPHYPPPQYYNPYNYPYNPTPRPTVTTKSKSTN